MTRFAKIVRNSSQFDVFKRYEVLSHPECFHVPICDDLVFFSPPTTAGIIRAAS